MGKRKPLTDFEKGKIVALKESGRSNREIANNIARSPSVIDNFIKKGENYGKKGKQGRPNSLTDRNKKQLIKFASNKKVSCAKLKSDLNFNVSIETIRKSLHQTKNLTFVKMNKKPKLTESHKKIRLEWSRE